MPFVSVMLNNSSYFRNHFSYDPLGYEQKVEVENCPEISTFQSSVIIQPI